MFGGLVQGNHAHDRPNLHLRFFFVELCECRKVDQVVQVKSNTVLVNPVQESPAKRDVDRSAVFAQSRVADRQSD